MNRNWMILGMLGVGLWIPGCDTIQQVSQAVGKTNVSYTMKNGEKVQGTLLQDGDGKSLVQVKYGTLTVTKGDVLSVENTGDVDPAHPGAGRLSKWDHALQVVAARSWAVRMTQIPATVVDKGIMKNVPYISHRAGAHEFNIYGDPEQPAALELGIYERQPSVADRKECIETMMALLTKQRDRQALEQMNLEKETKDVEGLTIEVTPPTADDAYGAWWISIYDRKSLGEQQAKDDELAKITMSHEQVKGQGTAQPISTSSGARSGLFAWKDHDLKNARPVPSTIVEPRVYVRGVYRKNGVYVVWPA